MTYLDAQNALADRARRMTPVSKRGSEFLARRVAEHEAAHAVVGLTLGLNVKDARIYGDGTGETDISGGTLGQRAATWVAGDLWIETFAEPYLRDSYTPSCTDTRWQAEHLDAFARRDATARCITILRNRRADVLKVAEQLVREGVVRWPVTPDHDQPDLDPMDTEGRVRVGLATRHLAVPTW